MAHNVIKKINRLKPDRTYECFDIGTDSKYIDCNDNSLLIPIENPTLEKILPLKLKQETIDDKATKINSLDNINEQGLYYISKTDIASLPDNITSPFNLLVLTNGNSFRQILFKEERIYIRDNFSSAWSAALAKPFEGSNNLKAGTKGLVPAPKTTETGNFFLNANGKWTNLNNITFTSVDNNTPTFSNGFTSQGVVYITASDSTDGTTKALSVTHGISAASITASGDISTTGGNISTSKGDISTDNGNIIAKGSISTDNGNIIVTSGDINATKGNISASGNGKFGSVTATNGSISIKKKENDKNIEVASISNTGVGSFFGGISVKKTESNGGETEVVSIKSTSTEDSFSVVSIKKKKDNTTPEVASISNTGVGTFSRVVSTGTGEFNDINIKVNGTSKASINNLGDGNFNNIKINSSTALNTSENKGAATIAGGAYIGGAVKIGNTTDTVANDANTGALLVSGGAYIEGHIRVGTNGGVYGALWNDLADSIVVNQEAEIEAGYCYCLKDNKYIKSSKYLDNGIIGIHSDTYGFKMGEKAGEKQLDCAVAGFVLAYVDKDYLPGTALTCTKDGHLTKIKPKDKQRFPEKVIATYWKDEPNEEWGSDTKKVKVNGRKWVKIK